ncbi:type II CRISPR-associated endonuclease Cas1 [Thalassospira lucentensis]|uniref:type II CRISPR-associated endonuclease Cas1 n=1 Tax=Thalassospira lucentensis TaxID=168935 RepID=UPI00399D6046
MDRIIEIASDDRHLAIARGSMEIHSGNDVIGRVPLDDIGALICSAHGLTYSNNLIAKLAERSVPVVLCGPNHMPIGYLMAANAHHQQSKRIMAQADASRALKNRLWKQLVQTKIEAQAAVLETLGKPHIPVGSLIRKVKSGDPENIEGQAAQRYWQLMFGTDFRRDRFGSGPNAALNYGYAVLRAATARATLAAGLHPSLGLHHRSGANPMNLVDDLIEPFRPIVDLIVFRLWAEDNDIELQSDTKRQLATVTAHDLPTDAGASPVMQCLHRLAGSLAQCYLGESQTLALPLAPLPLELG